MARMSLTNYADVIVSLRLTYFKEQLRQSPVLTGISLLFIAWSLLQIVSVFTAAFSPIPKEFEALVTQNIEKIKLVMITALPVVYLFRQILFAPFLIAQSNSGFFRLYPIPNIYISLTRWLEGWTSVAELLGNSFLFLVLSLQTGDVFRAGFYWLCWCIIFRTTIAVLYEFYCLFSDSVWLIAPLYILLLLWIMLDVVSPTAAAALPKMSAVWSSVDKALAEHAAVLVVVMVSVYVVAAQLVNVFLYGYRMKKLGVPK
jgi:hypothetical protein